jgi:hypothetical protein
VLTGFVLGCSSTGPRDQQKPEPAFNTLLGTYRVNLTQAYLNNFEGGLDTTGVGHYEGVVTLGELSQVNSSDTVSADFTGAVHLTGTFHSTSDAGSCCTVYGSFSPATIRAQWRPEGRYDLRVENELLLGVETGVPATATVAWTLLPGVYSYHDSTAERTIVVQREPDDTNLPYPNASGLYRVTGTFDDDPPADTFTGTLELQQANRQSGVLTGSATIKGIHEPELVDAMVSTAGVISFRLGQPPMTNRWEFTGTLSQNTITGRHVYTSSVAQYPGSWEGIR